MVLSPLMVPPGKNSDKTSVLNEMSRRAKYNQTRNIQTAWNSILIYPEATCSNRTSITSFKSGAFIPGAPIQPIYIQVVSNPDIICWTWDYIKRDGSHHRWGKYNTNTNTNKKNMLLLCCILATKKICCIVCCMDVVRMLYVVSKNTCCVIMF